MVDFVVAIGIVLLAIWFAPSNRRDNPPHPKHLRYREVWEDRRDDD